MNDAWFNPEEDPLNDTGRPEKSYKAGANGPKTQKNGSADTLRGGGGWGRAQEPNICARRKVMSYLSDYY